MGEDERGLGRRTLLLGAGAVGGVAGAWVLGFGPFDDDPALAGGGGGTTTDTPSDTAGGNGGDDPLSTPSPSPTPTASPTPERPTFEVRGRPVGVVANEFGDRLTVTGFVPNFINDGTLDANLDLRNDGDEEIGALRVEGETVDDAGEAIDTVIEQFTDVPSGEEFRTDPQLPWSDAVGAVRFRLLMREN